MGLMQTGVKAISGQMPKMISPTAHAVIDYAIAGSMFVAAALLWRKNRKAAIASIACGAAEVATALITDYPGGVKPLISFRTQRSIDSGMATLVASMPSALRFDDDDESRWFQAQGIAIAAVTGLTDFDREKFGQFRRAA